ncbi:MAG: hypothetical protein HQM09_00070 [Candidatus Riflebacteria bacterium]|nr:hypothetical protein [Candidatus Riflebacteria bacterium]
MKRTLFAALLAVALVAPVFAADPAPAAPAAPAAVAPAAEPAAAPAAVKLEGKIIVTEKEKIKTVVIKTADAEITLLPSDKLTDLLKVEKLAEKTFVLEGEKIVGKDKVEGFMIKSFEEKKADAAAPKPEEKK